MEKKGEVLYYDKLQERCYIFKKTIVFCIHLRESLRFNQNNR